MDRLLLVPVAKPDSNKLEDVYEVAADIATEYTGMTIRVPKLFQFDGASIPSPAWQLVGSPFHPRLMTASVFHDWLYHTHQLDQQKADDLFHRLLLKDGVGRVKAGLMLAAVATFGGNYWENDRDDRAYIKRMTKLILDDGRNPADYGLV